MKTKSRFLRAPVEPFVVLPDAAAGDLLARMERISFQGRNLAIARRIWEKMLGSDATIFLGTAGALSAGGMRLIIAHLIEHRYIDVLVSTGANLYHDLHETRGRRHYMDPRMRTMRPCRRSTSIASTTPTRARTSSATTTSGLPPSR